MVQTAERFFEEQCEQFTRNDLAQMTQRFALPTAIYFGERIMIFKTFKTLRNAMKIKRAALLDMGYVRTGFHIFAQSITMRKHLSIWVEFRHFDRHDNTICTSSSRYFCARQSDLTLQVQLVEYLQMPQLNPIQTGSAMQMNPDHQATLAPR